MTPSQASTDTMMLARPGGDLAYDVRGSGPLVVCLPGMGELRSTYRFLAPALANAGYRVATVDLRGHGESDTTFSTYDDEALASDAVALVEKLQGPAVIVGNSMGAAAAVIAAAARPDLIRGLVLLGPFVRNPSANVFAQTLQRVLLAPAWARLVWKMYLPKLYAGLQPDDFAAYRDAVSKAMKRPGRSRAFSRTTRTSHDPAEAATDRVKAPSLVIMGALDPDFPDPGAEARWIAERLGSRVVMAEDCGHYPQSQRPDITTPAVVNFLDGLPAGA